MLDSVEGQLQELRDRVRKLQNGNEEYHVTLYRSQLLAKQRTLKTEQLRRKLGTLTLTTSGIHVSPHPVRNQNNVDNNSLDKYNVRSDHLVTEKKASKKIKRRLPTFEQYEETSSSDTVRTNRTAMIASRTI